MEVCGSMSMHLTTPWFERILCEEHFYGSTAQTSFSFNSSLANYSKVFY